MKRCHWPLRPRRRLYLQIYLAVLGIVVLFAVLMAGAFALFSDADRDRHVRSAAVLAEELLPPPGATRTELQAVLERLHGRLQADIRVLDADGAELAAAGAPFEAVLPDRRGERTVLRMRRDHAIAGVRLADGRWVLLRQPRDARRGWLVALLALAIAIAIGAHPLARRITRRLERLRTRVEALGGGDLAARVEVEGDDEVAELARSFNRAAARIEQLVEGQRLMLAGASHELRSPLTRLRMGVELLAADARPQLHAQMSQDIAELDQLIDELLATSRLRSGAAREVLETVDLLALAAEEAARAGADASGEALLVDAEPGWLRRAVRNLLENAGRHGGSRVAVTVSRAAGGRVVLAVEDDGPGVAEAYRERIFEPFFRPPGLREGGDPGVGLGLALVRLVAERNGGSVRCTAAASGGARFELDLPAAGPTSPPAGSPAEVG